MSRFNYSALENVTSNLGEEEITALFTLSEEACKEFSFISTVFIKPIVCILGLTGNLLGLGVVLQDTSQQKMSIYIYLCALTTFDILYLLVGLLRSIPNFIGFHDAMMANYVEEHMQLGLIYVDMVLSHTSTAIIVVMSIERLLALVRPFKVKHTWLATYPRHIITFCFVFNLAFLVPFPMYFEVGHRNNNNTTIYFLHFKENSTDVMDTFMFVQTIIDFIIPICVLLGTSIGIAVGYSRVMRSRRTTLNMLRRGASNRQKKITATVFLITLMYFLLSLPNLFIKLLAFTDEEYNFNGKHKVVFWFFIDLSNIFTYINAANDFVIYILVSEFYRRVFVRMYCSSCIVREQAETECVDLTNQSSSIERY